MTQIDSTAQTDLGISDHEELLLPYKVSFSFISGLHREITHKMTEFSVTLIYIMMFQLICNSGGVISV